MPDLKSAKYFSDVKDPHYTSSSKTSITLTCLILSMPEIGVVPMTVIEKSSSLELQSLYDDVSAGFYGEIAAYVAPVINHTVPDFSDPKKSLVVADAAHDNELDVMPVFKPHTPEIDIKKNNLDS